MFKYVGFIIVYIFLYITLQSDSFIGEDNLNKNIKKFSKHPKAINNEEKGGFVKIVEKITYDNNYRKEIRKKLETLLCDKEYYNNAYIPYVNCIDVYSYNGLFLEEFFIKPVFATLILKEKVFFDSISVISWVRDYYIHPTQERADSPELPTKKIITPFLYSSALAITILLNEAELDMVYKTLDDTLKILKNKEANYMTYLSISNAISDLERTKQRIKSLIKLSYLIYIQSLDIEKDKNIKVIKGIEYRNFVPKLGEYFLKKQINVFVTTDINSCNSIVNKNLSKIDAIMLEPAIKNRAQLIIGLAYCREAIYLNRTLAFETVPLYRTTTCKGGGKVFPVKEYTKYAKYCYKTIPSLKLYFFLLTSSSEILRDLLLNMYSSIFSK